VQNEKEFARTYAEIADLLRHEYSLAFVPPALDGMIHELRVEVKRPAVQVEHRPAYLAAAATGEPTERNLESFVFFEFLRHVGEPLVHKAEDGVRFKRAIAVLVPAGIR
jgi:hypothetical protein